MKRIKEKIVENVNGNLRGEERVPNLTVEELQNAELNIVRYMQSTSFAAMIKILGSQPAKIGTNQKKTLKDRSLQKLNPELKVGTLVVGGRLKHARVNDEAKHPIILPYKHRVTDLVIEQVHIEVGHMGQESVLSALREHYWIVKGRSAVSLAVWNARKQRISLESN